MNRDKRVSPQDSALFREAAGAVTPLVDDRIRPERRRPRPVPARGAAPQERAEGRAFPERCIDQDMPAGAHLLFVRPGVQTKVARQLKRGRFPIEADLDLHGKTVAEAGEALELFLSECAAHARRCVRIVHGKGFGSSRGLPVIKSRVDGWLRLREEVLAFCSARPEHGGTGAVYVLLRR